MSTKLEDEIRRKIEEYKTEHGDVWGKAFFDNFDLIYLTN